jgi:hypothetical protein
MSSGRIDVRIVLEPEVWPTNTRMQLTVWSVTTLAGRAGVLAATWPEGQGRASPARS